MQFLVMLQLEEGQRATDISNVCVSFNADEISKDEEGCLTAIRFIDDTEVTVAIFPVGEWRYVVLAS